MVKLVVFLSSFTSPQVIRSGAVSTMSNICLEPVITVSSKLPGQTALVTTSPHSSDRVTNRCPEPVISVSSVIPVHAAMRLHLRPFKKYVTLFGCSLYFVKSKSVQNDMDLTLLRTQLVKQMHVFSFCQYCVVAFVLV